jgi:hypothetical protein
VAYKKVSSSFTFEGSDSALLGTIARDPPIWDWRPGTLSGSHAGCRSPAIPTQVTKLVAIDDVRGMGLRRNFWERMPYPKFLSDENNQILFVFIEEVITVIEIVDGMSRAFPESLVEYRPTKNHTTR